MSCTGASELAGVRSALRLSVVALATALGVPGSTLQGWLSGRSATPPEVLERARCLRAGAPAPAAEQADTISEPRLLGFGVDALHVGYHATVPGALREQIKLGVDLLQTRDARKAERREAVVQLGGLGWVVTGGPGKAREALLEREEAVLVLGRESQPNPNLRFEFRAHHLWNLGLRGAWEWAAGIAQAVHDEAYGGARCPRVATVLSRIDLTCDSLGIPFAQDERDGPLFVCAATMTDHDMPAEPGMRSFRRRSTYATGWSWGKGDHVARIYRKAEEITKVSGKRWFVDVWRDQSGVEVDLDRDRDRIWRVEHQLRRDYLKALVLREPDGRLIDVEGIDGLERALPLIWAHCNGTPTSSGWLSWRLKEGDDLARRSTWLQRPEWLLVQRAPELFGARVPGAALMLDRSRRAKAEALAKGAIGYLETCASLLPFSEHHGDLGEVLDWLRRQADRNYALDGSTFALEVEKKARRNNGDLVDAITANGALVERQQEEVYAAAFKRAAQGRKSP